MDTEIKQYESFNKKKRLVYTQSLIISDYYSGHHQIKRPSLNKQQLLNINATEQSRPIRICINICGPC